MHNAVMVMHMNYQTRCSGSRQRYVHQLLLNAVSMLLLLDLQACFHAECLLRCNCYIRQCTIACALNVPQTYPRDPPPLGSWQLHHQHLHHPPACCYQCQPALCSKLCQLNRPRCSQNPRENLDQKQGHYRMRLCRQLTSCFRSFCSFAILLSRSVWAFCWASVASRAHLIFLSISHCTC